MLLSLFLTAVLGQTVLGAPAVEPNASPALACDKLAIPEIDGFKVTSAEGTEVRNFTLPADPSGSVANFCNFTITINHDGTDDVVFVGIWLPLDNWNGRFLATGGSGLLAGTFANAMIAPVASGFAAGSTDAGLTLNQTSDPNTGEWAIKADRSINDVLLKNFATRSIHEMTVIGKAAVEAYYGTAADKSYYHGCSQGGRQGYFAAQYSPDDYDGILANAPAINAPQLSAALFWPSVVMNNIAAPPQCVFQRYQQAIIEACDPLDGATDGLISTPEKCDFDTTTLVGEEVNCTETGGIVSITEEFAAVVSKTLEGARTTDGEFLWFGNPPGASFSGLANTKTEGGVTVPVPFQPAESWVKYFIAQDPDFDTTSISFSEFEELFEESVRKFTEPLGNDNPDLTAFKQSGGKLLSWHGMADPLITHEGTGLYWDRLQKKMGGPEALSDFYRLFLAPGAGHCSGGYGPVPVEPLSVLVDWVENGKVPDTLFALTTQNGVNTTRDLCPYPQTLRYKGEGDLKDAASFVCEEA